jgi:hypothetical protein
VGPTQWVPRALSTEVKRPGREADHSSLFNAEVKNAWYFVEIKGRVFMAWELSRGQLCLYLGWDPSTVQYVTWCSVFQETSTSLLYS